MKLMSQEQANTIHGELLKTTTPLEERIKELQSLAQKSTNDYDSSYEDKNDYASSASASQKNELTLLLEYKTYLADWMDISNTSKWTKMEDVFNHFNECIKESEKYIDNLKDTRSSRTVILDVIKNIANFFVKVFTLGHTPQFFNTTVKPVESIKKGVETMQAKIVELANKVESRNNDNYGDSSVNYSSSY
ncbi:MAG: hypothetical protein PSV35_01960 [bacterium]|nr:hypothetical protein [bacterium]